jgi:DNA (cytosine-5)-methyltransferase 1
MRRDVERPVFSLHLFAGAGGGLLADVLLGITPVCAVEIDDKPRRVLAKRFPGIGIWDDVRTFCADNPDCSAAFEWFRSNAGALVVAGGFPCQDISAAGLGIGINGKRSGLWSEFARILREIRPRYCFLENSPMLVGRGLGRVLGDLAALGYDARWNVLGAAAVGARHRRDRIWITGRMANGDRAGRKK